jgi:hypothetical protein
VSRNSDNYSHGVQNIVCSDVTRRCECMTYAGYAHANDDLPAFWD